jgi:hypothetical protein
MFQNSLFSSTTVCRFQPVDEVPVQNPSGLADDTGAEPPPPPPPHAPNSKPNAIVAVPILVFILILHGVSQIDLVWRL